MQDYINSDYEETNNNIEIIANPLDIKMEKFGKLKIIKYFIENNIL